MSPRAGITQARFEEQFDVVPTTWNNRIGTGTESIVAYSDPQSGKAGNAYQAAGYRWRAFPTNILFDPKKLYRMRIRARRTATSDAAKQKLYCGVEGVAADGATLVNVLGANDFSSQHYFAALTEDLAGIPLNEWRIFTGYFQGRGSPIGGTSSDPNNPKFLHKDAKYFRPLFIINYDTGPAGNVSQIDYIIVEALGDTGEFVHLLEISFSGGTTRINTGAADLNWNGQTWEAVGGALSIGNVEESPDPGSQGVQLQLSGVDQDIVAVLLNNTFRGRTVKIWRAFLDPVTGQVIPDPLQLLEGLQLDPYEISEDRNSRTGGTVSVRTRVRGRMGVDRMRGIWANVTSHQHVYPGDTFFQNAAALANTPVYWGVPRPIVGAGGGFNPHNDASGGGDQFVPG